VKEAGYIFVYLSYDNASDSWVMEPALTQGRDDLKVTHTKSNVIQYNEYYPFGLQTASSWTRENTTGNNFLYNEGTELNPASSLYDLEFRNYDPILGRMHQVDPMVDKYSSLTPYNYAFNDPSGADPNIDAFKDRFNRRIIVDYTIVGSVTNPGFSSDVWNKISGFTNALWDEAAATGFATGTWNGSETVVLPHEGMSYAVTLLYEGGKVIQLLATSVKMAKNGAYFSLSGGSVNLPLGAQMSDDWEAQLEEFVQFFFDDELRELEQMGEGPGEMQGWRVTFWIDRKLEHLPYDERTNQIAKGSTTPLEGKKVAAITLNPRLFLATTDKKQLYVTIAHELNHARQIMNGNWLNWGWNYTDYERKMIMETLAYSESYKVERGFGVDYGSRGALWDHYNQLPADFFFRNYNLE
jgi:RHS repeat-associated protein